MDLAVIDHKSTNLSPFPCKACYLCKSNPNPGVGWRGSDKPSILFIGEALTWQEAKEGASFIGKAGQFLEEALKIAGIPLDLCAFTNTVQCIPVKNTELSFQATGNSRPPTEEEIIACQPRVLKEIAFLKPTIIVPVGAVASFFLLGLGKKKSQFKTSEVRGKLFEMTIGNNTVKVFPTIHPSAVLRNPSMKEAFINDMNVLASIFNNTFAADMPKTILARDTYQAIEIIQHIIDKYKKKEIDSFAMDLETSTLHPWQPHARILGAALAYGPGIAWYIPLFEHGKGLQDNTYQANMDYEKVIQKIKELVETVPWKNQNIKFDIGWTMQKTNARPFFIKADTMGQAFLIWGELRMEKRLGGEGSTGGNDGYQGKGNFSLKALARDFLKRPDYARKVKVFVESTDPPSFANVPLDAVREYAGIDAETVVRLVNMFQPLIKENGLSLAEQIVTAAAHAFAYIELNGVAIDKQYLAELTEEFPKKVLERYKTILQHSKVQEKLEEVYQARLQKRNERYEKYLKVKSKKKKYPKELEVPLLHWKEAIDQLKPDHLRKIKGKKSPMDTLIGFNPSSPPQIADLVFNRMQLKVQESWISKKSKKPSVSKKVVKAIANMAKKEEKYKVIDEFTKALLAYRDDNKILTSYVESLPRFITPFGVLYSNYDVIGTRTGRLSTSDFSLHTTPKGSRSPIKKLFISRWRDAIDEQYLIDPSNGEMRYSYATILAPYRNCMQGGGLIVSADYSQLELRLLAILANDTQMLRAFEIGHDLHQFVASLMYYPSQEKIKTFNDLQKKELVKTYAEKNIKEFIKLIGDKTNPIEICDIFCNPINHESYDLIRYKAVTKKQRSSAKAVNFGLIFGASPEKIAEQSDSTVEEAKNLVALYYATFPNISVFINKCHYLAHKYKKTWTPIGNYRILDILYAAGDLGAMERVSQNTPIQGAGSYVCIMAVIALSDYLQRQKLNSLLIGSIHDAILADLYPGEFFEVVPQVKHQMETVKDLPGFNWMQGCKWVADTDVGVSWGQLVGIKKIEGNKVTFYGVPEDIQLLFDALNKHYLINKLSYQEEMTSDGLMAETQVIMEKLRR